MTRVIPKKIKELTTSILAEAIIINNQGKYYVWVSFSGHVCFLDVYYKTAADISTGRIDVLSCVSLDPEYQHEEEMIRELLLSALAKLKALRTE